MRETIEFNGSPKTGTSRFVNAVELLVCSHIFVSENNINVVQIVLESI